MKHFASIFIISILLYSNVIGQSKKDSLYVFVGKKIEVKQFKSRLDSHEILFNAGFKAKYVILQKLYGDYYGDTIEFEAYDHYGWPAFSKYENVLLFVSNYEGKLYHEKYQFFDVYKTKNGRWASGYKTGDYGHIYNKTTSIKPELIDFEREVSYDIKNWSNADVQAVFPSPYYKIQKGKAIVVWGNYIEQLFELKKSGVLKARGMF